MEEKVYQVVIINEQHTLSAQQLELLREDRRMEKIPSEGYTLYQLAELCGSLKKEAQRRWLKKREVMEVVFVSPIPVLINWLSLYEGSSCPNCYPSVDLKVKIMHNDKRDKKELPNGRVVYVVAQDGWVLV